MTNWSNIRQSLPAGVTLVAVSKYHPVEQIAEAYAEGCREFGESRVQELKLKRAALPEDIRWHFIGHLQTNKVRDLLRLRPYLIQSVDSEHLLRAINDEAAKQGIVQDVLLELHVAQEATKSGFTPDEFKALLSTVNCQLSTVHTALADRSRLSRDKNYQLSTVNYQLSTYPNVRICGVMGMATNTDDADEIRRCFRELHDQYQLLNCQLSTINSQLSTINYQLSTVNYQLSMGMSDDYPIAISEGSTMVRIGSAIFGER